MSPDTQKKLSLAMIVKDEEDCIRRCLDSVKDLVDEMIIVDTGSVDQTVAICRSYNAEVFSFPWNNNFAEARNFGLSKVKGEWVIWLDADEEVGPENREQLNTASLFTDYDALSVPLINFYGEQLHPDEVVQIAQPRIFRNHLGFQFENKIHEWLNLSTAYAQERVGFIDLKIYHYGYLNARIGDKQKYQRNITLLLKELEEDKGNPWIHYYLATEHYRRRCFNEAFAEVNEAITLFLKKGLIPPPSMLYSLKYSILLETGSWEGAWPGIESAVKMFPDYVDLKFYKGVILYLKKMFPEALATFAECIQLGENNLNYLTIKGLGSFRAWLYRGLCLVALKREEEAAAAYLEAVKISPDFTPAKEALVNLVVQHPNIFTADLKNAELAQVVKFLTKTVTNEGFSE